MASPDDDRYDWVVYTVVTCLILTVVASISIDLVLTYNLNGFF